MYLDLQKLAKFIVEAKKNTYPSDIEEIAPERASFTKARHRAVQ